MDKNRIDWCKVHRDIEVLELLVQPDFGRNPEVIVAGIEGRAIVRAGMQRELRFIGEVK